MTTLTELLELEGIQSNLNLSLIMATVWIIHHDFSKYTIAAITMGQYAINRKNHLIHNDLMNEIFKRSMNQPNVKFFVQGEETDVVVEDFENTVELLTERDYITREKSIIFLDSLISYRNFELDLLNPKYHFHRSGVFLLIYTGTEPERLNNVKEIFRRAFNLYITNINVMLIVGKVPYLYTYFPFAKNKCHSSMPQYYMSFRDVEKDFLKFRTKIRHIYPDKVKNMHGCKLLVTTWTFPPYVYVDQDEKTGELKLLHGIEGLLISLLSEVMNFKMHINAPEPKDRGDIYPNGTATGAAKMIVNAEANLTIMSYMYNKLRSEAMEASYSYATIPYVVAIPRGKKMSPIERLIKPFRYIIWSCLSASFIFAIIFIFYIRFTGQTKLMDFIYGQGNRKPLTNLLSTLFGGSVVTKLPYRTFARYLLVIWLLYTFVLRSAYSGALFQLLQDGRPRRSFSDIQEVVNNNYTFYAYPATVRFLQNTIPGVRTGTVDAVNTNFNLLQRISEGNEKVALSILEYSVKLYNQMNPNQRVDILDQPLFTSQVVFFMPRHTYLKYSVNELILRILASGIMQRFESYYLYSKSTFQSRYNQSQPLKLSLDLLYGLFGVYAVLLLICLFMFLLELWSLKSNYCKAVIDFFNFEKV